MIFNNNQIFAKVWKSTVEEKYIDLQISTSEKDGDGNYKNSSWFPRVIGHAYNTLKDVKEGDRITITKSKFTNERYEDKDGNKRQVTDIIANEVEFLSVRTAGEGGEFDVEPMRPIRSERPQLEPVNEEDLPF